MKSKKSHEGYSLIDHTFSPGVPNDLISSLGILTAAPGTKLEMAIFCCKHCQAEVIKNPDRTRPRGYCPNCDHYICDKCELKRILYGCRTIEKVFDEILEAEAKKLNIGEI